MTSAGLGVTVGATAGAATGILAALLKRKMDNDQLAIQMPEQEANIPMINRPEPVAKKPKVKKLDIPQETEKAAFDPTIGQIGGFTAGAAASYGILNKLFQRKNERQLDMTLKNREDKLNQLLLHEQSLAAGLPKAAMSLMNKSAEHMSALAALEKIAEDVYAHMIKAGSPELLNTRLSEALAHAANFLALDKNVSSAIPLTAAGAGMYSGASYMRNRDPNTLRADAVRNSLRERLTGKDNLVGPMPIRVESDTPEMTPLRPGASSLVDPTKGRDVLEGI